MNDAVSLCSLHYMAPYYITQMISAVLRAALDDARQKDIAIATAMVTGDGLRRGRPSAWPRTAGLTC